MGVRSDPASIADLVIEGRIVMKPFKASSAAAVTVVLLASFNAHAVDRKYRARLERSGCTQVSEAQGCDISKTRAENAKAGFGTANKAKTHASPPYKDMAGTDSIGAIDSMSARGFKDVDSFESGNTLYGIFYHAASHACIQLAMADGKVISADDIHTHAKCH